MIKSFKFVYCRLVRLFLTIKWGAFLLFNRRKIKSGQYIIAEGYVKFKGYGIKKYNWGDDLNKYLFERITGREVKFIQFSRTFLRPYEHYVLIGSILNFYKALQG